jgi:hypothetical protein
MMLFGDKHFHPGLCQIAAANKTPCLPIITASYY